MGVRIPLINSLTIAGRLTRDPETRTASGGAVYTKAGLAVDDGKDKDGKRKAFFLEVAAFNKSAERLSECRKGAPVMLEGRLSVVTLEKEGGDKRTYVDIIADGVHPLEWLDAPQTQSEPQGERVTPPPIPDDDIPF